MLLDIRHGWSCSCIPYSYWLQRPCLSFSSGNHPHFWLDTTTGYLDLVLFNQMLLLKFWEWGTVAKADLPTVFHATCAVLFSSGLCCGTSSPGSLLQSRSMLHCRLTDLRGRINLWGVCQKKRRTCKEESCGESFWPNYRTRSTGKGLGHWLYSPGGAWKYLNSTKAELSQWTFTQSPG